MTQCYEYKTIPAPMAGSSKEIKDYDWRFAHAIDSVINDMARKGWDYMRKDTLPVHERRGWLRRRVQTQCTLLVFRRVCQVHDLMPNTSTQDSSVSKTAHKARNTPTLNRPPLETHHQQHSTPPPLNMPTKNDEPASKSKKQPKTNPPNPNAK